jgi:dihydrolipoamide dehydrogenase
MKGLWRRGFGILKTEAQVLQAMETRDRLRMSGCDLFIGAAEFVDADLTPTVRVCRPTGCVELTGKHVCIATGSRSHRPSELRPGVPLPFTANRVIDSTEVAALPDLPNAVCIIGGGVIAVEYATVFAELGVGVSLICKPHQFLPFLEAEMRLYLKNLMKRNRILFVEEDIQSIQVGSRQLRYIKYSLCW